MGKNNPNIRDGSGPAKGSYRKEVERKEEGRRKEAGEDCPESEEE